jgi:hypothetical protein
LANGGNLKGARLTVSSTPSDDDVCKFEEENGLRDGSPAGSVKAGSRCKSPPTTPFPAGAAAGPADGERAARVTAGEPA